MLTAENKENLGWIQVFSTFVKQIRGTQEHALLAD
jgi:hypothetical protein